MTKTFIIGITNSYVKAEKYYSFFDWTYTTHSSIVKKVDILCRQDRNFVCWRNSNMSVQIVNRKNMPERVFGIKARDGDFIEFKLEYG